MERKQKFTTSEYYHVYSRGVERRKLFMSKKDYTRFVCLLYIMNQRKSFHFGNFFKTHRLNDIFEEEVEETLVDIVSYVLMPNHFHLILYEKTEGGISKFMMKLLTAYSMYFNTKYERSGPLFVRPFRSQHISGDSYFLWIFSYVHLNPVKLIEPDFKEKGIKNIDICKNFLKFYTYSSYIDYIGINRPELKIINLSKIPEYIIQNAADFGFYTDNITEGSPR